MFKVETDKDFYEKFSKLQSRIGELSTLFQNPNIEIIAEEFGKWNMLNKEVQKELNNLIKEGAKRIKVS
jgi:hypothetical protein